MLTADRLRELLHYDPATGVFTWLVSPSNCVKAGAVAGSFSSWGYRCIGIDGRYYRANRLAWLYMTGEWPAEEVDHENLVRDNDRWTNLREATTAQNRQNSRRRRHNTSGVKGVSWHKGAGKWQANIQVNGHHIYLGLFTDLETAAAAYAAASAEYHGKFARTE